MENIGRYIKEKRTEKGMSARELSRRSGVSQPYLSQLESGKNSNPSIEALNKIAKGLGVLNADLMMLAGYISDPFDYADQRNKEQEQQDDILIQKATTFQLEYILNSGLQYNVLYKDRVLSEKDKQKILKMIETLLD